MAMDVDGNDPARPVLPTEEPWHPDPPAADEPAVRLQQGNPQSPLQLATGSARLWISVAAKYGLTPEGRKKIAQYLVTQKII